MKKPILLMLVVFIVISCSSGLKQKSNYDSPYSIEFTQPEELQAMEEGRSGFGYCTDGKYLYAINGSTVTNTLFFADALRYDIENDKWTQLTDKLIRKRYCSAEYLNGKIFVFNGIESNGINNNHTEVMDVKTGEISVFQGNPNPVTIGGSAQWQGKIYVYGGGIYEPERPRLFSNQVWEVNPALGKWTLLTQMPIAKEVRGDIVDGVLYLFGGYFGEVSHNIDMYNILTNTWTRLEATDVRISANAVARHGKFIWLVGSYHTYNLLAVFDTVVKKLYFVNSNILGRKNAGATIVGDKLYVFGGLRSKRKNVIKSIQVADISEVEKQLIEARGGVE